MNDHILEVSTSTAQAETLTPSELKALIARIRQQFDRPLPDK